MIKNIWTKCLFVFLVIIAIQGSMTHTVFADSEMTYGDLSDFWEIVPDDASEYLPDEIKNADLSDIPSFLNGLNGGFFAKLLSKLFGRSLKDMMSDLGEIIAIIALASVAGCLGKASTHFEWVASMCMTVKVYSLVYGLFRITVDLINTVCTFVTSFGTIMSALYLSGGNSLASAAHIGWIASISLIGGGIVSSIIVPTFEISMSVLLVSSICRSVNIQSVAAFMQRFTTGLLVFIMTAISIFMSFQTSISAASDSMSVRTVKFAAAQAIPVIGGMLGDSIKVLSSSVSLIRSVTGTLAAVVIIVMSLSPLILLFVSKSLLSLGSGVASMLGSATLSSVLSNGARLIGHMMAVIAVFDIAFIYCLSIFVKSVCAIS